jgi:enoyl-CoA hydratase/carnithine racemase
VDLETLVVRNEGPVLFADITAPPMNLLGPELVRDLVTLIQDAEADDTVQVLVFTSADPDYFISHVDLDRIAEYRAEAARLTGEASIALLFHHLSASRLVTMAQIEGRVRAAGSEFVLACDMRFAALETAIFGQFEPAFGLLPGGGAAQHLTRLMGRARALEVMLSAQDYGAELAERYGWINRALPAAELPDFVRALAHRIGGFPASAHSTVKERVNAIALAPAADFRRDSDLFGQVVRTPEVQNRIRGAMERGLQTREAEMSLTGVLDDPKSEEVVAVTTEAPTTAGAERDLTVEEKIQQLRVLFAGAPEVGKKALENVLSRLSSDASQKPPPPVASAGRVGSRLGKVSELTIIVPFAPGGADRLRAFLQLFGGNLAGADDVGTVHDMRFAFLDNDTRMLFATAYDGDWDAYIDDFATKIPDFLDIIDSAWEGWPGIRSPEAKDYLAKHQVAAEGWYVANDLTVAETRRLRRIGQAVEELLDAVSD